MKTQVSTNGNARRATVPHEVARKVNRPIRAGTRKLEKLRVEMVEMRMRPAPQKAKKGKGNKWAALDDLVRLQESLGMLVESVYRIWKELGGLIDEGFSTAHKTLRPKHPRGRPGHITTRLVAKTPRSSGEDEVREPSSIVVSNL